MTFNSISGIVRDEANQEVANATVALIKQSGGSIVEYTQTDSNGSYEFTTHQEADATEEDWHVAVYDDVSPIFNSFSKPYVSATLNLGVGEVDITSTLDGLPTSNGLLSLSSEYTGTNPNSTLVFQEPVAYNNLVAWFPFDSGEYGGANADDVTAIEGGSGDGTAYDGTVNGATHQPSGGVTDINAGADSGAFDFDGADDFIGLPSNAFDSTQTFSLSMWINGSSGPQSRVFNANDNSNGFRIFYEDGQLNNNTLFEDSGSTDKFTSSPTFGNGTWAFICFTFDDSSNQAKAYIGANNVTFTNYDTITTNGSGSDPVGPHIGGNVPFDFEYFDGRIDDVRIYNTALSSSQVQQIYQNTQP